MKRKTMRNTWTYVQSKIDDDENFEESSSEKLEFSGKIFENDRKSCGIGDDENDEGEFEDYASVGKQWENPIDDINDNNLRQGLLEQIDVNDRKNIGDPINIPTNMSCDKIDTFSSIVKEQREIIGQMANALKKWSGDP